MKKDYRKNSGKKPRSDPGSQIQPSPPEQKQALLKGQIALKMDNACFII